MTCCDACSWHARNATSDARMRLEPFLQHANARGELRRPQRSCCGATQRTRSSRPARAASSAAGRGTSTPANNEIPLSVRVSSVASPRRAACREAWQTHDLGLRTRPCPGLSDVRCCSSPRQGPHRDKMRLSSTSADFPSVRPTKRRLADARGASSSDASTAWCGATQRCRRRQRAGRRLQCMNR